MNVQNKLLAKWIKRISIHKNIKTVDVQAQLSRWLGTLDVKNKTMFTEKISADLFKNFNKHLEDVIIHADASMQTDNRSLTGSYYTPVKWANYMVKRSLSIFICDVLDVSFRVNVYPLEGGVLNKISYSDKILLLHRLYNMKIIDIACGTGVFLMQAIKELENVFEFLIKDLMNLSDFDVEDIQEDDLKQYNKSSLQRHIAMNIVHGWDMNRDALALYLLWLINRYGLFYDEMLSPVQCVDSLSDEQIKYVESYDLVIGNPPYLGEKGHKELFNTLKNTQLGKAHYCGKMDLSYYFVARALEILKPSGILTYIMTNYFITADGAKKLRENIRANATFIELINFNNINIFEEAKGQHNIIFSLRKNSDIKNDDIKNCNRKDGNVENINVINCVSTENQSRDDIDTGTLLSHNNCDGVHVYQCDEDTLYQKDGKIVIYSDIRHSQILSYYEQCCDSHWGDIFEIKQGLVSGADRLTKRHIDKILTNEHVEKYDLKEDMPIFVFTDDEILHYKIERHCLRKFYKNSDISHYILNSKSVHSRVKNTLWIPYTNGMSEDELQQKSPRLYAHLLKFYPILAKRREVKQGSRKWYELHWHRTQDLFETDKIVVPQRNIQNKFAFVDIPMYASADVYYFKFKNKLPTKREWYYHLAMANSSILYMWLYNRGKKKGRTLELYAQPLKAVKVISYKNEDWQNQIIEIVGEYIDSHKNKVSMETDLLVETKFINNSMENISEHTTENILGCPRKYTLQPTLQQTMQKIDTCIFDALEFSEDMVEEILKFRDL